MRQRFRIVWSFLAVFGALAGRGSYPALAFDEPSGFGQLKFLAKEAEIKTVYPKATLVVAPETVPDGSVKLPDPPFSMNRYALSDAAVGSLKNCKVDLQCFKGVFYQAALNCSDNAAAVEKYLRSTYGQPTKNPQPHILEWYGQKTHVSFNSKGNAFLIEELPTSLQASRALQAYIASQLGGPPPQ